MQGYAPAANFADSDFLLFPVEMRATPEIALFSPNTGTPQNGKWSVFHPTNGWVVGTSATTAPSIFLTKQGFVARQYGGINTSANLSYTVAGNFTADAEL
jgi:hypothetical protein